MVYQGILLLLTLGWSAQTSEAPVKDSALEARLTETKTYTVRRGDTLDRVAYLLYGHRSWWKKLLVQNPSLKGIGPHHELTTGSRLKYLGPKVGAKYRVRENEFLAQIAEWKFGSQERWEDIYLRNKNLLDQPNLIHPGTELVVDSNGVFHTAAAANELERKLASFSHSEEGKLSPLFWVGFSIGTFLFMLLPAGWLLQRWRHAHAYVAGSLDDDLDLRIEKQKEKGKSGELLEDEEPESYYQKGYPYTFDTRPPEELKVNTKYAHRERGWVDRRPSYHSLLPNKSVNYLKSLDKKKR